MVNSRAVRTSVCVGSKKNMINLSEKLNGNARFGDLDVDGQEILSLRLYNKKTEVQRSIYFAM
jgi:hypothetical protein